MQTFRDGDLESQRELVKMYLTGEGMNKNITEDPKVEKLAVTLRHAPAMLTLGLIHSAGWRGIDRTAKRHASAHGSCR